MKCLHKWKEIERKNYTDYSGYKVLKIIFKCENCDKKCIKKYF